MHVMFTSVIYFQNRPWLIDWLREYLSQVKCFNLDIFWSLFDDSVVVILPKPTLLHCILTCPNAVRLRSSRLLESESCSKALKECTGPWYNTRTLHARRNRKQGTIGHMIMDHMTATF